MTKHSTKRKGRRRRGRASAAPAPGSMVQFREWGAERGWVSGKLKGIEGDVAYIWTKRYGYLWANLRMIPTDRLR